MICGNKRRRLTTSVVAFWSYLVYSYTCSQTSSVQQEVGERTELQALEAERADLGQLLPPRGPADERPSRQVTRSLYRTSWPQQCYVVSLPISAISSISTRKNPGEIALCVRVSFLVTLVSFGGQPLWNTRCRVTLLSSIHKIRPGLMPQNGCSSV